MSITLGRLRPAPVLIHNRNGAGTSDATFDGTYRGPVFAVAGVDRALVRLRYTKGAGSGLNIRFRDASDDGNTTIASGTFPLLSQTTSHSTGAGELKTVHNYTATTDDLVYVDLKGMVGKLAVEVASSGGSPNGTDVVLAELVLVEG